MLAADPEPLRTLQVFPYERYTVYAQHYASKSFVESDECTVGTIVSLPVIMVVDVEEQWNRAGSAYARVMAVDADHATMGPLHLWEFPPTDSEVNAVYMFRGLNVALGRVYNDAQGTWSRSPTAPKVVECNVLMAIERVDRDAARSYFS